jgi:hypothetical protein
MMRFGRGDGESAGGDGGSGGTSRGLERAYAKDVVVGSGHFDEGKGGDVVGESEMRRRRRS